MCRNGWILSLFLSLSALILSACQTVMPVEAGMPPPVSTGSSNSVLLILREHIRPADEQFMATDEAIRMKSMLEEAGFRVVIASASGRTFRRAEVTLESDMTLAEVEVADYIGFIIPCMALGTPTVKPEEVAMAKQIVAEGKPVAAQQKGVRILAEAGALVGKRYSYQSDRTADIPFDDPPFDEAIYDGDGLVQDGNIITSSYCPFYGSQDQTDELTQALIAELQK